MQHDKTSTKIISLKTIQRTCRGNQRHGGIGQSGNQACWCGLCVGLGRLESWRGLSVALGAFGSDQQIVTGSALGRSKGTVETKSQRSTGRVLPAETWRRTNHLSGPIVDRCTTRAARILPGKQQVVDIDDTRNPGARSGDIEVGQEVVCRFGNRAASGTFPYVKAHIGDEGQSRYGQRLVAGPVSHGPQKFDDDSGLSDGSTRPARVEQGQTEAPKRERPEAYPCMVSEIETEACR